MRILVSGWTLVILFLVLASFNARKKLAMLPLGSASLWLTIHWIGGISAIAIFWWHTGVFWPTGFYERVLALLFYLISLNGLFGLLIGRIYPPRLTETGLEVIYERIPGELAEIRERAEAIILSCTQETGSLTLAKHYLDSFQWFFARPRFFISHALGGQKGAYWIRHQGLTVRRYLGQEENRYLGELILLAEMKNKIDFHYAAQGIMKGWLLMHLPLSVALVLLVIWHLILVHVYAL